MICLYIYGKKDGTLKRVETGLPNHVINDLAENEDFTLTPPPTLIKDWRWDGLKWIKVKKPLEERQAEAWEAIKQKRYEATTSGVYVASVDKVFHTDEVSVIQYNNIGNMITLGTYEPIQWKVVDNTWVTLTESLYKELQVAMVTNTNRIYQVAERHKEQMLLADDPENYDYSSGWDQAAE